MSIAAAPAELWVIVDRTGVPIDQCAAGPVPASLRAKRWDIDDARGTPHRAVPYVRQDDAQ